MRSRTGSRSSSKGIVLSRESFGEADQYIQFFTQNWGMITVLAKSARKSKRRYIGGLDIFCHDEIFIKGDPRERPYLNELSVLNSFPGIRDGLDRLIVGGKIVQWVRKLADVATPMPSVYSLLGQTLSVIEKETDPLRLDLLGLVFKLKLLANLGLKPRVEACVRCEDEHETEVVFDVESGGILCKACSGKIQYGAERLFLPDEERSFLHLADRFRLTAWEQLDFPRDKANHLTRLVTQFASFHSHVKLPA